MNIAPKLHLQTPVGRLVTGSLTTPSLTDMHGKPRAKPQFFYGIAVRKDDPALPELFGKTYQHAFAGYAQYPHIQDRMLTPRNPADPHGQRYIAIGWAGLQFAWKIEDGDAPKVDRNNPTVPAAPNPLTVGCWVFKFSSIYAPRVVNGQNQVLDANQVAMGSFVDVAYNIEVNGKTDHTAGIYANPTFLRWLAYGQEIVRGPQPDQVFKGGVPTALPPGASHTPIPPAGAPGGPAGVGQPPAGAYAGHMAPQHAAPPHTAYPPAAGGHLQQSPGAQSHASGVHQGAYGNQGAPGQHAAPPATQTHMAPAGTYVSGGVSVQQNPPTLPPVPDAGNGGYPAGAPAVPAAPPSVPDAGSIPAGSSPVSASHSNVSPHPDFVTGGPQAA